MKKTKKRNKQAHNSRAIGLMCPNGTRFAEAAACLAEIGKGFHARGWALGTSGNFSAVISREPLRLAITSTGLDKGSLAPEGYEMLKGLEGVRKHKHREWLPILENSQDMIELGEHVSKTLRQNAGIHGFLLREHGLYTWGAGLQEAKRHVEILEFLLEVLVRSGAAQSS